MYQGIFIDDRQPEQDFASLLSTPGKNGLTVKFKQPTQLLTLANHIIETQPALVALDYRLDEARKMPSAYQVEPLAQQLRSYASQQVEQDFPIILLAHENEIVHFLDNITAHDLFDSCFTKQEVVDNLLPRQKIFSLVKGYKRMIKNWRKKPERWATFFGLNKQERVVVAYQAIRELDKLKAPHQVARWILRYVIERQGILLDKDNVLAHLGVANTSHDIEQLFAHLKTDKVIYTGVFGEGWMRWWRYRLEDWEKQVCGEVLGNLTARERVLLLNKKLGLNLSPAISRWQAHSDALFAFACDSCHQPTEQQCSVLAYEINSLPYSFIRRKRICWKCVETGEFVERGLAIDDGEIMSVEMIQNGEMRD